MQRVFSLRNSVRVYSCVLAQCVSFVGCKRNWTSCKLIDKPRFACIWFFVL